MHKNAIKPAFNYGHYRAQRLHKVKILKKNMYALLDNPEEVLKHAEAERQRTAAHEEYFYKEWGIK